MKPEQLDKVSKLEEWRKELKLLEDKKEAIAASWWVPGLFQGEEDRVSSFIDDYDCQRPTFLDSLLSLSFFYWTFKS